MKESTRLRLEEIERQEREKRRTRWRPGLPPLVTKKNRRAAAAVIVLVAFWWLLAESRSAGGRITVVPSIITMAASLIVGAALVSLYLLPYLTAKERKHPSSDGILVLNLFLGWTGIGWVIALAWAASKPAAPPK